MANESDQEKVQETGGKKKSFLLFAVVGVVVLLGLGAGAYFFLFSTPSEEELAKQVAKESEQAPKSLPAPKIGVMFELNPFVVNLADPRARHFLKTTITLELVNDAAKERAQALLPRIRNDIILLLSSQTMEDVITMEGKIRLRDEMMARLNRILGQELLLNIYFSQFVVQ